MVMAFALVLKSGISNYLLLPHFGFTLHALDIHSSAISPT